MLNNQMRKLVVMYIRSDNFEEQDLLESCISSTASEYKEPLLINIICRVSYDVLYKQDKVYCDRKWFFEIRNRVLALFYYQSTGCKEFIKSI